MTRRMVAALAVWVALLVGVRAWGVALVWAAEGDLKLDAIPLYGRWDWEISWRILVPIVVGAAGAFVLPVLANAWPWRAALGAVAVASVLWSLALAMVDPGEQVWSDIDQAYGRHTGLVDEAGGIGGFLRHYVENQPGYPVHLQAHPPGLPIVLRAGETIGLAGPGFQTVLAFAGVAAATVTVVVLLRDVADDRVARAAAPFVALLPAAVWHTNADVIVGGIALAGVASVVLATGRRGVRATILAAVGGGLLGASALLSYGIALLAVPVLVVAVWRRRPAVLGLTALCAAGILLLPLAWGFWWFDGLVVTTQQYDAGVATVRGYGYFVVANLAVFALAIGPATVAALGVLRDRRVWIVVGSGLAVVALADVSGLSSGETERIWQPFVPLVAVAGCALGAGSLVAARWWLALQVVVGVALQAALRSPW